MKILFKNDKTIGWALDEYIGNTDDEQIEVKKTKKELNNSLSEILEEGETWQDKYTYLSLDDNKEIYCDLERYNADQEK
jgi:hypothetical protein